MATLQTISLHLSCQWGGVYLYANQKGCDGGDLYYDGSACIVKNGKMVAQSSQFGMDDVEVISATVDLEDAHKSTSSFREMSAAAPAIERIHVDHSLCTSRPLTLQTSPEFEPRHVKSDGMGCHIMDTWI